MRSKSDFYDYSDVLSNNTNEKSIKIEQKDIDPTKQIKIKSKKDSMDINLKSPIQGSTNIDFLNKQVDGNSLNEVIDNLIVNTNSNQHKNNSRDIFSNKSVNDQESSIIKKGSLNNSLFKAGESIVGSQFSSSISNSQTGALKKVNERLRYLEKLEKESSMNLNKQKEKIRTKNQKKEEEMKKKIEDVKRFYLFYKFFRKKKIWKELKIILKNLIIYIKINKTRIFIVIIY